MLKKSILNLVVMIFALMSAGSVFAQDTVLMEETVSADQTLPLEVRKEAAWNEAEDRLKGAIIADVLQHVVKLGDDVMVIVQGSITNWSLMEEFLIRSYDEKSHKATIKLKIPKENFDEFTMENVLPSNMPVIILSNEEESFLQPGEDLPDLHELRRRGDQGFE